MSDLVERLRFNASAGIPDFTNSKLLDEAASRIEALEAALRQIAKWSRQNPEANAGDHAGEELLAIVSRIAALAPQEQDK